MNMKLPSSILVVINSEDTSHIALERALQFALLKEVYILLFSVVFEPLDNVESILAFEYQDEAKSSYVNTVKQCLEKLSNELETQGIHCSVNVQWHQEREVAIEKAVKMLEPDLVIKQVSANSNSINPFAMPIDRHLLRYCSAPLLLITQAHWHAGPITLAIDPSAYDTQHIELNKRIMDYGQLLKTITNKDFNVVSSFHIPSVNQTFNMYGVNYDNVHEDSFRVMRDQLFELLKIDNITKEQIHVVDGAAEYAIPKFINVSKTGLLVLGTVGRTGFSGLFIGNTAERILAEVNCEILALKY